MLVLAGVPACRERTPAGEPVGFASIEAPVTSAPPVPPAVSSSAPAPVLPADAGTACGACAPGTACQLTKKGLACVVRRECTPKALHCFDGDVYRCSADGASRTLATRCVVDWPDGSLDTPKGPCQEKNGVAACHAECDLPDHTVAGDIVALHDCKPCRWEGVPFCATESPERGCFDWVCVPDYEAADGAVSTPGTPGVLSPGAVSIPCWRDTEGLVVPGSDAPGACEGPGAVGARKVAYQVCRGGRATKATRVEPCTR